MADPDPIDGPEVVPRTPAPSDWEQATILMKRNLHNDTKKKMAWFARLFLGPLMYMLYVLGFLFYDRSNTSFTVEGGYRLYSPAPLVYPDTIYFGSSLPSAATSSTGAFLKTVQDEIEQAMATTTGQVISNYTETNAADFQKYCETELGNVRPDQKVCVFLESLSSYKVYFGADQSVTPFEDALVGTQYAVQSALLTANGYDNATIRQLQNMPTLDAPARSTKPDLYFLIFPGVMLLLASAIQMQFYMAPLSIEKFKEIARSFFLVGVKHRVYLHQWLLYLSLGAALTAGAYTGVFYGWSIVIQSNLGLLFASHYLNLIHMISFGIYFTQIIDQEELTQSVPWFGAIISAGVSVAILVLDNNYAQSVIFSVLAVFSPFCAMMQFCAIYLTYDIFGFQGGIHPGFNVYDSGLLASLLAQTAGILFWNALSLWVARPRAANPKVAKEVDLEAAGVPLDVDKFEPLPSTAQVLLRVAGLGHTFEPPRCQSSKQPVEVLNGLDLEICRGEVFGYLGHNSSGKTTSIKILSGELPLQAGDVCYHLRSGDATLTSTADLDRIRRNVGICPQHNDALHGDVSAREFLRLFAYLKGRVPQAPGQSKEDAIEAEVDKRLGEIKFTSSEDADKPIETYSGGMKRKVCIALAFLSDPEVVFLDEPSAGIDPYNRRQVWDMIIAAKAGRSIILTTHFLDEADVLSDRVGILKGGHLIARGSTLFLKHKIGGYGLRYDASEEIDISKYVNDAKPMDTQKDGSFKWELNHGSEASFPSALRALDQHGAANVSLELTSLEQVFLETGREATDADDAVPDGEGNHQEPEVTNEQVKRIWELRGTKTPLSYTSKFLLVSNFMFTNAWKIKGLILLNIIQPCLYVVVAMVLLSRIDASYDQLITPDPILLSPYIAGDTPSRFFGVSELSSYPMDPIIAADETTSVADLFGPGAPFIGGYLSGNQTLQSNTTMSPFARQLGLQVLGNYTVFRGGAIDGIGLTLAQLPFIAGGFRIDLLILPLMLALGFAGIVFAMLDVLLLKADNIIGIFRVNGITQFSAYNGVILYKVVSTWLPFFVLVIALGFALKSLLMGSSGRWLGTILIMLAYAWSSAPLGVLVAERFIKRDFKRAANIFPGVYMTLVSLPYIAWNMAQQFVSGAGAQQALLIIGDFLLLIPPVAFQRAIGAVLAISTKFDDPDLTWADVWSWKSRVWFSILMMFLVGTLEWIYLYHLTTRRPPVTNVKSDEHTPAVLTDCIDKNFGVAEEIERSLVDDEGINARNLVKFFRLQPSKRMKKSVLKQAVKGASFGVRKGEIYAVVGPNGAGKSTAMAMLAGELTPEQGEVALSGRKLTSEDRSVDHLFHDGRVAFCPQFDALFPQKTVREHLMFYATVRGLDINTQSTIDHVDAIVRLLGLDIHLDKLSTEISGGYKRRTCLAISMIGYPDVMMVDECTTGLDPGARHLVWKTLKPNDMNGVGLPAILLSTHYMDEASRLGDRIGIFVDGELVSTGSLPDLQAEYCKCYFVEIALRSSAPNDGVQKTLEVFDANEIPVHIYESIPFHFKLKVDFQPSHRVEQLARIFELLEGNRETLHIQFYSVAQMNLEAILLDLSRRQFAAEESTRNLSSTGVSQMV